MMLFHSLGCFNALISYGIPFFLVAVVVADTPANCTYEDARGRWIFEICAHPNNCSEGYTKEQQVLDLLYPNLVGVVSGFGSYGHWTLIYNQGFEVTVGHRKWLVMFAYSADGEYFCDRGNPGWTHDSLLRQWLKFTARKLNGVQRTMRKPDTGSTADADLDHFYRTDMSFINRINSVQKSWTATYYPELEKFTLRELRRRRGGVKSAFSKPLKLKESTPSPELIKATEHLPDEFDWRFPPEGRQSPVTPVRDQSACGSCYAFASTAALEARVRLWSNFTRSPILSPQDVVDCSPYSEGCDGGFPYLIAGKYAEDFGIPEEDCNPYKGAKADTCPTKRNCTRYYATNYHYIGGYYGACSEHLMKLELVTGGPFPIGFEVYDDFMHYRSGVYHHTMLRNPLTRFDPFELTNHAVLLVGYGFDAKLKLPYWAVKNSWGTSWGEDGYFRILRGSDECSIESLGVAFDPVL